MQYSLKNNNGLFARIPHLASRIPHLASRICPFYTVIYIDFTELVYCSVSLGINNRLAITWFG